MLSLPASPSSAREPLQTALNGEPIQNDSFTNAYCEPNDLLGEQETSGAMEDSIELLAQQRRPANQDFGEAVLDQLFAELALGG